MNTIPAPDVRPTVNDICLGDTVLFFREDPAGLSTITEVADEVNLNDRWATLTEMGFQPATITVFAGGIPNAQFIAWNDYDHRTHVAVKSGHPLNRVYAYNGKNFSTDSLTHVIAGRKVVALAIVED